MEERTEMIIETAPSTAEAVDLHLECERLKAELQKEQAERMRLSARYYELEDYCSMLTRLHVAADRLLTVNTNADVFSAVQEIVANLIGSEEVGIFLLDEQACNLKLVASSGIDTSLFATLPLGASTIGRTAVRGETLIVSDGSRLPAGQPQEASMSACIPLKRNSQLLGAIAIFRLLEQHRTINAADIKLLKLLGKWASLVLNCTKSDWN